MYQVINSTFKTQRKGFVIMLNPEIYNKIAEEIIYKDSVAIGPVLIHLTPNGVIIEKSILLKGKEYKSVTKIQDFKVEGDFASAVSDYMEKVKEHVFTEIYLNAKAQYQQKTDFSK